MVEGDIATFNVYNQRNEKVAEFMVDRSDIDLIKYKKWRLNSLGYIVSGNCTKTNPTTWLHRILLQPKENEVVDHIDGRPRLVGIVPDDHRVNEIQRKGESRKGLEDLGGKEAGGDALRIGRPVVHQPAAGEGGAEEEGGH